MNWEAIAASLSGVVVALFTYLGTRDKKDRRAPAERDEARAYVADLLKWGYGMTQLAARNGLEHDPIPQPPKSSDLEKPA